MSMAMKYAMKKRMAKGGECPGADCPGCGAAMCHGGKMAEGGEVATPKHNMQAMIEDDDMISRIMKKRYSEGGVVANETKETADEEPNEFDDLVKDDDLEFSETGANSGDELGDEAEDEDRKDIVSRIMKSRAKKDKNPRPA